jgi:hypothetical protein
MARDIDRVIEYVNGLLELPPVMKRVIINRLNDPPTPEELERAKQEVLYGKAV